MAEIIVAPHAGFCFGVKRAIALAERVSVEKDGKKDMVYGTPHSQPSGGSKAEEFGR
jgi:4-hydroxy-3-methylbut-2-enyl diphosphate reductase IspH